MVPISFNYDNTLEKAVGTEGLRPQDLKIGEDFAVAAAYVFKSRVESGEVGFPLLPEDRETLQAIMEFVAEVRGKFDNVLLVGIGGSALGASALDLAMHGPHTVQFGGGSRARSRDTRPHLIVLDNIDPGFVAATLDRLSPKRTLVCVVAKSGSTAETMATYLIVREWMTESLGRKARAQIVTITDPHKGDLLAIARKEKYPLFFIPENVGGRFSVFTPAGLVPAALTGTNIQKLLKGAKDANRLCWNTDTKKNPALASAVVHHALDRWQEKRVEVVFAYSQYLLGAAFWYRQLWAESLGKEKNRKGKTVVMGQTPVVALGATDQHSQLQLYMEGPRDKMITFWDVEKPRSDVRIPKQFAQYESTGYLGGKRLGQLFRAERIATEAALTAARRPNCRWTLRNLDEYTLGMFLQTLEYQTAFAGELFGINAYDQPGVEVGKKMTYGIMGRKGYEDFAKAVK